MKRVFGIICIIWALIFAHLETNYFGNNWLPQTSEELICDLTSLFLCIAGNVLLWQKRN